MRLRALTSLESTNWRKGRGMGNVLYSLSSLYLSFSFFLSLPLYYYLLFHHPANYSSSSSCIGVREKWFNVRTLLPLVRESEHMQARKKMGLRSTWREQKRDWQVRGANKKGLLFLSQIEQGESFKLKRFWKGAHSAHFWMELCTTWYCTVWTVSSKNFAISLLEETLFIFQLSSPVTFFNMLGSWVTKGWWEIPHPITNGRQNESERKRDRERGRERDGRQWTLES